MMKKKAFYTVLVCGLLLSGCASTGSDSRSGNTTSAEKTQTSSDCAASGQKSYEMANGSIVCY